MKTLKWREGSDIVRWEHDDGNTVVERTSDLTPIIEANKKLATMNDGMSPSREMRRVASVPVVVLQNWCQTDGISYRAFRRNPKHYQKWLRRKLYDPDNRFLLTAPHRS